MNTFASPMPSTARLSSRSLGGKFFVIMLLAFVMSISGFFVEGLTTERANNHGLLAASSENPTVQPTNRARHPAGRFVSLDAAFAALHHAVS